jgi:hypothetical protein
MNQEGRWSPRRDLVERLGGCEKKHWVEHHQWRFGQLPGDAAREETRELWEEQGGRGEEKCLIGKEIWPSEEEEEEQHAAHKQVPGGSVEEAGLGGQREVDIVEGRWEGKEQRSGCREEWQREKEASHIHAGGRQRKVVDQAEEPCKEAAA